MRLFIAEKKVLGEAIAEALDGKSYTKDGVIFKGENVIVWCSGHLLTLREPESYNERYKSWNLTDLPIYFENWENAVPEKNKARIKQIGDLIKQADEIVNCGDTDEEGQLLVDEVLRWFSYKGSCKRLDTANTTVESLKKALRHMKDNKECETDGWSAYAREVADMTFGVNFTRFFSKKYNARLPVGRVMTPTLGLVVNRDKAIEGHRKTYYYILNVKSSLAGEKISLKYVPEKDLDAGIDSIEDNSPFEMKIHDVIFTERKKAGELLRDLLKKIPDHGNVIQFGEFCGFQLGITKFHNHITNETEAKFIIAGAFEYKVSANMISDVGNVMRIQNAVHGLEKVLTEYETRLADTMSAMESSRLEFQKEFPQEEPLQGLLKRQRELDEILSDNPNKKEDENLIQNQKQRHMG